MQINSSGPPINDEVAAANHDDDRVQVAHVVRHARINETLELTVIGEAKAATPLHGANRKPARSLTPLGMTLMAGFEPFLRYCNYSVHGGRLAVKQATVGGSSFLTGPSAAGPTWHEPTPSPGEAWTHAPGGSCPQERKGATSCDCYHPASPSRWRLFS